MFTRTTAALAVVATKFIPAIVLIVHDVIMRPASPATSAAAKTSARSGAAACVPIFIIKLARHRGRPIAIRPWRGRGQQRLTRSSLLQRLLLNSSQLRIRRRILDLPIAFDQFETEIKVARLNRAPSGIESKEPIGPN
jgi:hypothetical protein